MFFTTAFLICLLHCQNGQEMEPVFNSQAELVAYLRSKGHIKSDRVADVMTKVDRKYYIPGAPYKDVYRVFTKTGVVEDPPRMVAFALETLKDYLKDGYKALHVGSGSGYLAACMGLMVGPFGLAVGIENTTETVKYAKRFYKRDVYLKSEKITVKFKYGEMEQGVPELGPYNAVFITPVTISVPVPLMEQLARPARLVITIGDLGPIDQILHYDKHMNYNITLGYIHGDFVARRNFGPHLASEEIYFND